MISAEKLRLLIINKYAKYLGNTYQNLTLKKIMIILEQLRYRLYIIDERKKNKNIIRIEKVREEIVFLFF